MAIVTAVQHGTLVLPSRYSRIYDLVKSIKLMAVGRANNIGVFELNESPTTILDSRVSQLSVITFVNSSQQMAEDYVIWLTATRDGEFDIEFSRSGSPGPVNIVYAILG